MYCSVSYVQCIVAQPAFSVISSYAKRRATSKAYAHLAVHACNRVCESICATLCAYYDLNKLFIKSMQVLRMRSSGDVWWKLVYTTLVFLCSGLSRRLRGLNSTER